MAVEAQERHERNLALPSWRHIQTVWYLARRIREAMTDGKGTLLSGLIEIDETYAGGKL